MADVDVLHPDQLAVLQLVLRRGMAYGDLAGALGLDEALVRERALDALDGLVPEDRPGLEPDDRDRISDYLLGQQGPADEQATRSMLERNDVARGWAQDVAARLDAVAGTSPTPAPAASPAPAAVPAATAAPSSGDDVRDAFAALDAPRSDAPTGGPRAGGRRRLGTILIGGAATILVILVILAVAGVFNGSDGDSGSDTASTPTTTTTAGPSAETLLGGLPQTIRMRPTSSTPAAYRGATATIQPAADAQGQPVLAIQGSGFRRPTRAWTYGVWLTGGSQPARILTWFSRGPKIDPQTSASTVDSKGRVQQTPIPLTASTDQGTQTVDPRPYTRVIVTRETATGRAPTKPGPTVLSGSLRSSN